MLIVDAIRSRIITIAITATVAVIGTVFAFSPQLSTLTSKVAAIEATYITKQDFEHYQDVNNTRWQTLFTALHITQAP